MFDHLTGQVSSVGENRLVIDCGGVGFLLTATSAACNMCAGKTTATVPVYLAVREDALELYGFGSESEREIFLLLISVGGVGAKLAVTLLSGLNINSLMSAIASGETAVLCSVKGVGKKTAERIVLELKGKIEDMGVTAAAPGGAAVADADAVLMLVGLGLDKKEAELTVRRVTKPGMTTEQIVRAALQGL